MHDIPECLNRRYEAVDSLIQQLSWSVGGSGASSPLQPNDESDPGIKLMCEFWNILKEDPDCDLKKEVKQSMGLATPSAHSSVFIPQELSCYMAEASNTPKWNKKLRTFCTQSSRGKLFKSGTCVEAYPCSKAGQGPCNEASPLHKALHNVNEAASFDKKCSDEINDLMKTQETLMKHIEELERKEKKGIARLKEADVMWSSMEEAYKNRLKDSVEKQNQLYNQIKAIDTSTTKWRKGKRELEIKVADMEKLIKAVNEQITQKRNDIKFVEVEVRDFKKRIETGQHEIEGAKKSLANKRRKSDIAVAKLAVAMNEIEESLGVEHQSKRNKEQNGNQFVKEGRQELRKICRILLQKKLQNEDLRAEKTALLEEIDLLNVALDQCQDRCKNKQEGILNSIQMLDEQIAKYQVKCIKCTQCTDTSDARKFCTDCPRCLEERNCLYKDGACTADNSFDCVCMAVKERFLDNVFENMYTVLERHSKNAQGKRIAEAIMECLKRSRNGKLNEDIKKKLQEFILKALKKNLNLTIVGGAVKTRCEMDPESYGQLMLCLQKVKATKPPKEEKGTEKKASCKHWLGKVSECHCPSGPNKCICSKKAPPPLESPKKQSKAGSGGPEDVIMCPHLESTECGPGCAAAYEDNVGTDIAKYKREPCTPTMCKFKNVRAVQCVLGPEIVGIPPQVLASRTPIVPNCTIKALDDMITCSCSKSPLELSSLGKRGTKESHRSHPRERIIEEVMGKYIEVSPIDNVTTQNESYFRRFDREDVFISNEIFDAKNLFLPIKTDSKGIATKNMAKESPIEQWKYSVAIDDLNWDDLVSKRINVHQNKRNAFIKTVSVESMTLPYNDSSDLILLGSTHALTDIHKKEEITQYSGKTVSWNDLYSDKELVKVFPFPKSKSNIESYFTVIFDSKFNPPRFKMNENTSPFSSSLAACISSCKERASVENNMDRNINKSNNVCVKLRNTDICKTANKLVREAIVTRSKTRVFPESNVEWITVSSFINKLAKNTKDNISIFSNEEVELNNTTLDATKYQHASLQNDLPQRPKKGYIENPRSCSIKNNNEKSQTSLHDVKQAGVQANCSKNIKEKSLSNLSVKSSEFVKNQNQNKCFKYFLQSMVGQTVASEPSCFRQFLKTRAIYRKPINLNKYLNEQFSDSSSESNRSSDSEMFFSIIEDESYTSIK